MWEMVTWRLLTRSKISSTTPAYFQGGLAEDLAHWITQKESRSTIRLVRFKRSTSLRPILIAYNSTSLAEQTPTGPKKERTGDPKLLRMIPPTPTTPRLPKALPSKFNLKP
eukprot:TRINITY_DN23232_c1_g1_i2.p1 TRINITY_DN23232_c1_g1~~TRINITY_DN23232_c1_g1_i2.p1  ORF type:complete len:111 (-),score=7.79 TRINITY_DN23232_c1_g1_i2:2-334(-)